MKPEPAHYLQTVLDRLIRDCCDAVRPIEVAAARAEFEARRGSVRQDEPLWEAWSRAFLEWYAVERKVSADGLSAAAIAAAHAEPEQRAALLALAGSQRLVAEVKGLMPERVLLRDLFGGASFAVTERRTLHGVAKGDVVEVRVIGYQGHVYFGRLFVHHPAGTLKVIEHHVRLLQARGATVRQICDVLAERRLRCERYQHVSPFRVYSTPPKIEPAALGLEGSRKRPTVHADLDV